MVIVDSSLFSMESKKKPKNPVQQNQYLKTVSGVLGPDWSSRELILTKATAGSLTAYMVNTVLHAFSNDPQEQKKSSELFEKLSSMMATQIGTFDEQTKLTVYSKLGVNVALNFVVEELEDTRAQYARAKINALLGCFQKSYSEVEKNDLLSMSLEDFKTTQKHSQFSEFEKNEINEWCNIIQDVQKKLLKKKEIHLTELAKQFKSISGHIPIRKKIKHNKCASLQQHLQAGLACHPLTVVPGVKNAQLSENYLKQVADHPSPGIELKPGDTLKQLATDFATTTFVNENAKKIASQALGKLYQHGSGDIKKNSQLAVHYYQQAKKMGDTRSIFELGIMSWQNNELPESKKYFEQLLKNEHEFPKSLVQCSYWYLGIIDFIDGNYEQACNLMAKISANKDVDHIISQCIQGPIVNVIIQKANQLKKGHLTDVSANMLYRLSRIFLISDKTRARAIEWLKTVISIGHMPAVEFLLNGGRNHFPACEQAEILWQLNQTKPDDLYQKKLESLAEIDWLAMSYAVHLHSEKGKLVHWLNQLDAQNDNQQNAVEYDKNMDEKSFVRLQPCIEKLELEVTENDVGALYFLVNFYWLCYQTKFKKDKKTTIQGLISFIEKTIHFSNRILQNQQISEARKNDLIQFKSICYKAASDLYYELAINNALQNGTTEKMIRTFKDALALGHTYLKRILALHLLKNPSAESYLEMSQIKRGNLQKYIVSMLEEGIADKSSTLGMKESCETLGDIYLQQNNVVKAKEYCTLASQLGSKSAKLKQNLEFIKNLELKNDKPKKQLKKIKGKR